ncbi:MAG: VCBS repeat-containing protein [Saprospiraceae bacterium]|nr:VCBS repeat-containing protein [Saprospiraceae bacterium]
MKLKWQTEFITNAFLGEECNFVIDPLSNSIITSYSFGSKFNVECGIKIINLANPKDIKKIAISQNNKYAYSPEVTIGDVDKDGITDIFLRAIDLETKIQRYDINGKYYWSTQLLPEGYFDGWFPKLADFNQDGIPELYTGNKIFNAVTGNLLIDTKSSAGCNEILFNLCGLKDHSIAADFTDAPGLELAAGDIVYEFNFVSLNNDVGNTFNIITAPPPVKEGHTTFTDINLDGNLDVVVSRTNDFGDGGIWVWNPKDISLLSSTSNKNRSGIPFIGNLNNDCYPELGICNENSLSEYTYENTINLKKTFTIHISEESGFTGITMFDFNQDGKNEIIHRDEKFLRIFEGQSGITLDSIEIRSATNFEYPIISDIDDDGQAEILVNGNLPSDPDSVVRIFCFESASSPWAPARKVWNQTGYHITNVNDDLTIPRQQQNNAAFFDTDSCAQATCSQPYNSFMCQATYRDQNGCVRWPAVDMITDILDYSCHGDSVTLNIEIRNQSTNSFRQDSINLALYSNSDGLPFLLMQRFWSKAQAVDTLSISMSAAGLDKIRVRVNVPGLDASFTSNLKGLTSVLECDYENNIDSINIDLTAKLPDLGPDMIKCPSAVVTFHAGSGFVDYKWTDFSADSIFSTSETGIFGVTVTDHCGRTYSDVVSVQADPAYHVELGLDKEVCPNHILEYDLGNFDLDWIQWYPSAYIDCDTCFQIRVSADTSFTLLFEAGNKGCVIVDSVRVMIKQAAQREVQSTICQGDSSLFYGAYYQSSGVYLHEIGSCDSIIFFKLEVLPPDSIILPRQEICKGDSLYFLGSWWKEEINATIKLRNRFDCDSFVTFELRVIDTVRNVQSLSICQGDSTLIFDVWQQVAGSYSLLYPSSQGCDSLSSVLLSLYPSYHQIQDISACEGDSVLIFGEWKKDAGLFTRTYQTQQGCDSLVQIALIIKPLPVRNESIAFCEGDSIVINGAAYYNEGSYQTLLNSSTGCDTLYTFQLNYSPLIFKSERYLICQGDSVQVNGSYYTDSDTILYLKEENNCKTEITATIEIIPEIIAQESYLICPDDSLYLNNIWVSQSTEIELHLTTQMGCDSTIQASITKLKWPEPPTLDLNCEESNYNASMLAPQWQVTWSNGDTTGQTALLENPSFVKIFNNHGCERTYDIFLDELPDLSMLPNFENQNAEQGDVVNAKVTLDPQKWKIRWQPSASVTCDTCFETNILADVNKTVTLEITHQNGCTYKRSFDIIVETPKPEIYIPNIIYPGSGSTNNTWTVLLPSVYYLEKVNIYDRWGNLVYSSGTQQNNTIQWDGKINGQDVVPGVYVYFIKLIDTGGKLKIFTGDITVVR